MSFDVQSITQDDDPGEPFPFHYGDEHFTFPPPRKAGFAFLHHYAHNRFYEAVQELLSDTVPVDDKGNVTGPSDFKRFVNLHLGFDQVSGLMLAYIEHAQTSPGKSEASTGSSKSTETPSKRTSPATTD